MTQFIKIDSIRPATGEAERAVKWSGNYVQAKLGKAGRTVNAVATIQTRGRKARCEGWFAPDRWQTRDGETRCEINISAETLLQDPEETVKIAIHEVIHTLHHSLDIADTASNGRHNRKFKKAAEAVGLIVAEPSDSYGYGYTTLSDELREVIQTDFKPDAAKWHMFRKEIAPKIKKQKPSTKRTWECDCGIKVNVAAGIEFDATCNECDTQFVDMSS